MQAGPIAPLLIVSVHCPRCVLVMIVIAPALKFVPGVNAVVTGFEFAIPLFVNAIARR